MVSFVCVCVCVLLLQAEHLVHDESPAQDYSHLMLSLLPASRASGRRCHLLSVSVFLVTSQEIVLYFFRCFLLNNNYKTEEHGEDVHLSNL